MPELADRIPGEIILASYNNQQRDRLVERYVDATARSVATPLPVSGTVSYLTASNVFAIFDGATWVDFATDLKVDTADALMQARLDVIENKVFSTLLLPIKNLSTTFSTLNSVTVPVDGDYLVHMIGEFDIEANPTTTGRVEFNLLVNTGAVENYTLIVRANEAIDSELHVATQYQLIGLTAGDDVSWQARDFGTTTNSNVQSYMIWVEQIKTGTMPGTAS